MSRAGVALVALTVAGCDCGAFVKERRFACTSESDCADGFSCVDRGDGLECVARGSGGGSSAGGVAGGRGGGSSAGGSSGGSVVAGGDAGGSSGGVVGGGDAGGLVAGGVGGGLTAGGAAGGMVAGGSASPATALHFATPARSVPIATCSAAITIEPVDARGVFSPATALITVASSTSVRFFTTPTCTGAPSASLGVSPASPRATFYAAATAPGSFMITALATNFTSDVQGLSVLDGPDTLVFTSTVPMALKAGACFPAAVSSRRNGMPVAPTIPVTVSFGASIGAARFYSDPQCEVELSSAPMSTSALTVFVRALSSPTNRITASVPLWAPAQLDVNATPMARRGSCTFDAQSPDGGADGGPGPVDTFAFCTQTGFAADAIDTIVFLQTSMSGGTFSDGAVRCRVNTSGTGLNCGRRSGTEAAVVHWQLLEDPSRVRIGLFDGTCAPAYTLSRTSDLSRTFLVRAKTVDSASYDDEDTAVFSFIDGGQVTGTHVDCGGPFLQAVEWNGVSVARGAFDGGMDAGTTSLRFSGLPPASTNRIVLLQHGTAFNSMGQNVPACATMGRATTPSPTEVAVRRGMGTAACATLPAEFVAFERVDFGNRATVQEFTVSFPAGTTSMPVTIMPVDASRTVVFASGQIDMGQGGGETSDSVTSRPFEAAFVFDLAPPVGTPPMSSQVTVRRPRAASSAAVTFYVLQAE